MKNNFLKIICLLWLIASILFSCKSKQDELIAPDMLLKASFEGEILGNQLSLKLDESKIFSNPSITFVTPDVFGEPSEVRLGTTLQNDDYFLSLTAPKIKYTDYNFANMQKLFSVGTKKMGTESLQTDVNEMKDNFVFTFSSKKLFSSNKAFISKGMEGHRFDIIESREIAGEARFEKGIQITARVSCKLYNGDKYEGDLKEGVLTLKFFYSPYK